MLLGFGSSRIFLLDLHGDRRIDLRELRVEAKQSILYLADRLTLVLTLLFKWHAERIEVQTDTNHDSIFQMYDFRKDSFFILSNPIFAPEHSIHIYHTIHSRYLCPLTHRLQVSSSHP